MKRVICFLCAMIFFTACGKEPYVEQVYIKGNIH